MIVRLAILVAIVLVAQSACMVWASYEGRVLIVDSQRAGCERGKLDRQANATGWRTAEAARRSTASPSDLVAAHRYMLIARGLEQRSTIVCSREFPDPSLLPF